MVLSGFIRVGRRLRDTASLMVGVPDYQAYLLHARQAHPDRTPMSYEEFFLDRQRARFDSGRGRCC